MTMLEIAQKIAPLLWFNDEAEEAANFYVSIFKNSKIDDVTRFGDAGPGEKGKVMMIEFQLEGQDFIALNGGATGDAPASHVLPRGGIALFVTCETQAELDHLWERLGAGGAIIQCGWLTDKFGVAWNIVPKGMGAYLGHPDPVKRERAMKAMMQMVKLDIDALRKAVEEPA
jgi:predicted 3-demethylubiquinone-9 3-methyltransferase (glyoxalase superfamily)